jgi:hypothetical protein
MSQRRYRTLCGLRSLTFERKQILLRHLLLQPASPKRYLQKRLRGVEDVTLAAYTPENHRVDICQGCGSSDWCSIDEASNRILIAEDRYSNTLSRTESPTLGLYQHISLFVYTLFQTHCRHQTLIGTSITFVAEIRHAHTIGARCTLSGKMVH